MAVDDVERSLAELLADAEPKIREAFLANLNEAEAQALLYDWDFNARPKQKWPDGDWTTWAIIAGRGFGKTWTGAQATHKVAMSGEVPLIHLVAPTPADYRDVMIEGPAGLQSITRPDERPVFYPSKRLVEWPNGVTALCFSAEDPEALRGPQCGFLWADEPGAWTYGSATWDQAQFGLRINPKPGPVLAGITRQIMTTTPKPLKWLTAILKDEFTYVTRGTTYENLRNLAPAFARAIIRKYEGTLLGRQELLAELIEAVEGALWTPELIESTRKFTMPETRIRVAVGVDPAVTSKATSDETAIVVACVGEDMEGYILEDATPGRVTPNEWARAAIAAYHRHKADAIVAEVNNGGDLVVNTIKALDPYANVEVVHASRGKAKRAQPVSALFQQERAHLLGHFPLLEDQMTTWVPPEEGEKKQRKSEGEVSDSPDRMDAMVWSLTWLMIDGYGSARLIA